MYGANVFDVASVAARYALGAGGGPKIAEIATIVRHRATSTASNDFAPGLFATLLARAVIMGRVFKAWLRRGLIERATRERIRVRPAKPAMTRKAR
jgi:hypothetical protein